MSRPFCITVDTPDNSARISGELTVRDALVLERYVEHARELFSTKAVRDGLPCKLSMSFDVTAMAGGIEAHLPDDDALAIVLHRLRPLILQQEMSSFVNACGVLGRHVVEPNVRAIIREQRELFDNTDRAQTWVFLANNVRVNAEHVLQDWLNGVEYHTDAERRARIEHLLGNAEVLVRYSLMSMLLNKIDAISAIRWIIRVVLADARTVRFEPDSSGKRNVVTVTRCGS